jgi:hypothetical protein
VAYIIGSVTFILWFENAVQYRKCKETEPGSWLQAMTIAILGNHFVYMSTDGQRLGKLWNGYLVGVAIGLLLEHMAA